MSKKANPYQLENGEWGVTHADGTVSLHPNRSQARKAKKLETDPEQPKAVESSPPWENEESEEETPKKEPNKMENQLERTTAMELLKSVGGFIAASEREMYGDLTPSQANAVLTIGEEGSMRQKELAESLNCSGGNITMIIDNLEKVGIVQRKRGTEDRRNMYVSLTAKGKKKFSEIDEAFNSVMGRVFEGCSDKDLKSLNRLLNKFSVN